MKNLIAISITAVIQLGCVAQMINRPGAIDKYAPLNENSRIGTIRYLNNGESSVVKERRKDAYKQMYDACNSRYTIVSEGPTQSSSGIATPVGGSVFYSSSEYWYINFQCENPQAAH